LFLFHSYASASINGDNIHKYNEYFYSRNMRFLIRANIPTEDGNKMVQDPNYLEKLEKYINKIKAEATYFFNADGNRVAVFIVDIQSADQIPVLAEPLFSGMGAHVEFHPVMSLDDLKKGIPQAVLEANSYRY
jgi:hypothetical protein